MDNSFKKTDKLINYIPIISGISLIYLSISAFNYTEPADIFLNNGLLSPAYLLLFMFIGYKYGLAKNDQTSDKAVSSQLKYAGIFYGLIIITTLVSSFITEGIKDFTQILLLFTAGVPEELWFVPAGIFSVLLFDKLKNKLETKTIVKLSAFFFILTLLITTYGELPISYLNIAKSYVEYIFRGSHCGMFTAILFVSLGVRISEKGIAIKVKKLVFILCASVLLMLMEITMLSLKADISSSLFFLSSVPATISIFYIILSVNKINDGLNFSVNVGATILFVGQMLCSICNKITVSKDFLFASLFSSTSEKAEIILLFSSLIAFAVQAYLNEGRWVDSFAHTIESFIIFILKPAAYIMTAFGTKFKNVILIIAFGTLPVTLYFFERNIKHSLWSNVFICCLVAIILCSLSYPMKARKKSSTVFTVFLFTAITIYLSSKLFDVYTYGQTGKMMLLFFLPLVTIVSNRKDFLHELLKNYTTGIYLSFSVFVTYCIMFRPYDITRYKGAFCNANMCGLYLVTVCAVALCSLPNSFSKKDFSKNILHWIVFGTSFGFILLTISRTALAGALIAVLVKMCAVLAYKSVNNTTVLQKAKSVFSTVTPFLVVITAGLVLSYTSVRLIPGLIDRPAYLFKEITEQLEYKVLPGAGLADANYISPLRFLQAWNSRSVSGYESVNELSTGRIAIYLEYLKNLSFIGHSYERMYIESEAAATYAHNVFLQTAYNCGIIAGVVYLAYCVFCLVYGLRRYLKKDQFSLYSVMAISTYVVCGMFESMEAYYFPLLFFALIGLLPIVCAQHEPGSQNHTIICSDVSLDQTRAKLRMQKAFAVATVLVVCIVLLYFIFIASSNPNKPILNEMLK